MAKVKDVKVSDINKKIDSKGKIGKEPLNKGQLDEEKSIWDKLSFVPIIIILGIVPLIVRLKVLSVTGQDMSYALGSNFADTFSYWKSNVIFVMAIIMILIGFFLFKKNELKSSKFIKIGTIALGIFILVTLVSAIVSPHKSLVWWGQYGLRGGFVTILSYGIITLYSIYFYKRKEDIRYILLPLGIMVIVESIIIVSQFMGKDIIFSDFVKALIIPSEYSDIGKTMSLGIEGKAYGTLFNPNYVGSFAALLLPIFAFVSIKTKRMGYKIGLVLIAAAIMVSLIASGSRAGILGIGGSVFVALVLFGSSLLKKPKFLAMGIAIVVVLGFGFNVVSGGLLLERIGSIGKDAMSIFVSEDSDILDNSVIKDMGIRDNIFSIDMAEGKQLNFLINGSEQVVLIDQNGDNVDYVMEGKHVIPKENLPIDIKFQKGEIEDANGSRSIYVLEIDTKQWFILTSDNGQLVSLDKYGNPITIETAESIGFSGKEHIGSNRGYIWSRSLPVLMDNFLFGVGPDAFVAEFPHGDIVMRNAVYGYGTVIADKPHNLYLQIGINQGIIALGAFLVLNGVYIVNSFKVYFKKKGYTFHDMFGIGIMLGIVGYLGAGMFNDSVVSVAPLYWCLLGIGFATNYINEKEVIKE